MKFMPASQKVFAIGLASLILASAAPKKVSASEVLLPETDVAYLSYSAKLPALESLAQFAELEFDMLWKGKDDKYIAEEIADGIFLKQEVATGDSNYKAALVYVGRLGKDKLLTEWEVIVSVYAASGGMPDSILSRTGRVNSDGRFVFDDAKAEVVGKAYSLALKALASNVLRTVQNGTPDLVNYWVADTTRKYEALKHGRK